MLGLLQIHFAASCIKRGIQLHSQFTYDEVENNGFNSLLQPCCPAKTAHCSLHIGFVPFKSTSLGMNHYIPFYPEQQTCKCLLLFPTENVICCNFLRRRSDMLTVH